MKHIRLFENFEEDKHLKALTDYLDSQKISYKVNKTVDPQVEDDSVNLDGDFYFQISAWGDNKQDDDTPYALWKGLKMLGEYKLPKVAVEMYKIEKNRK
jgi:hypothetical protein